MSVLTAKRSKKPTPAEAVFLLENGASMDQPTFHELYKLTPEGFKAELIGGIVYVMASPTKIRHGRPHGRIVHWLFLYSDDTEGIEVLDNTTNILGEESEPQPDACLYVLPEFGGQVSFEADYLTGPPDLIVEVANSSVAIDLGRKKSDYEQYGVREYIVVLAKEQSVVWFTLESGSFSELAPGADGLFRSAVFPGLWLEPKGLFSETTRPLTTAVRKGLTSPEHAAFVAELKARRTKHRKRKGK